MNDPIPAIECKQKALADAPSALGEANVATTTHLTWSYRSERPERGEPTTAAG